MRTYLRYFVQNKSEIVVVSLISYGE